MQLLNLSAPTTSSFTAPTTTDLTLAGGSTGASLVLGQGANANATITPTGTGGVGVGNISPIQKLDVAGVTGGPSTSGTSADGAFRLSAGAFNMVLDMGVNHAVSTWIQARDKTGYGTSYNLSLQPRGGNLLIGTTTDSGNGKLQLATHTTSAGGIGFGTDVSLFRSATGVLRLAGTSNYLHEIVNTAGTSAATTVYSNTGGNLFVGIDSSSGGAIGAGAYSGVISRDGAYPLILRTNGTTALTLASNQAATFAGAVTAPAAGSLFFGADATYGNSLKLTDSSTTRPSLLAGVSESAGTYTARSATPILLKLASDAGVAVMYVDSGKTPGNTYTPTPVATFGATSTTFAGAVEAGSLNLRPLSNSPFTNSAWIRNTANDGVFFSNSDASKYAGLKSDGTFATNGNLIANAATFAGAVTATGLTLNLSSGFGSTILAGITGYNNFTLNGSNSLTTGMGMYGGASGDAALYINAPATGNIYFRIGGSDKVAIKPSGNLLVGGNTDIAGSGGLKVFGTTPSTGADSGALQVAGGIYAGANSYFGGSVSLVNASDSNMSLTRTGGVALALSSRASSAVVGSGGTLVLESSNTTALTFDSSQNATFSGDIKFSLANSFDIGQTGTRVRTAFVKTLVLTSGAPATASSVGAAGTLTWDANYIYVCTATDTWKRVVIATW